MTSLIQVSKLESTYYIKNNVFCGRIHIFLTRIFPISEKSALNLNSNFNLENETKYDSEVPTESELDPKVKLENTLGTCCGHDRVINELEGFLFFTFSQKSNQ